MVTDFSRTLSLLRQERGISQRKAASQLGISQALLSHYENGIREPGLAFVVKACDYYRVSADYLLGRTLSRDGAIIVADDLYDSTDEKGNLRGSIMATLQKKLVVNTTNLLFDLLGKTGNRSAITAAGDYLSGGFTCCCGTCTAEAGAMRSCSAWLPMPSMPARWRRIWLPAACTISWPCTGRTASVPA